MKALRLLFLVMLIATLACNRTSTTITTIDPAFHEYLSGYTFGVINRESKIIIVLKDSVSEKKREKIDTGELFRFEPEIKGSVAWLNNRTVVFTPTDRLPSGTKYNGVFELGEVRRMKRSLRHFPLMFETRTQTVNYKHGNLNYYSRYNNKYMYLQGRVELNSFEAPQYLAERSTVKVNGVERKVKWEHGYGNNYNFRVDSIERKGADQIVELRLKVQESYAMDQMIRSFVVPGLARFNMTGHELIQEPEQKLEMSFSEYLAPGQDLSGLITIDGINDLSYQISGNTVHVYFKRRYSGEKKLTVHGAIKNYFGYPMGQNYEYELFFEAAKPQIRLVGKGTILPASGGVYYPFETVGLKKVDVHIFKIKEKNVAQFLQVNSVSGNNELRRVGEMVHESTVDLTINGKLDTVNWVRHSLDLRKLIETEPGAIYRVMLSFRKSYTTYDCAGDDDESEAESEEGEEGEEDYDEENDFTSSENEMYYDYYGDEYYYLNNYTPCNSSFYYRSARTRNILVSDVGMMAKMGNDNSLHVFINDLNSAKNLAGVRLTVYSYDHSRIATGVTNSEGFATWKLKEKDEPFLVIAENGKQRGYLKIQDGRSNSLSKFEVDGARSKEGIDGFIYAERGVWRPGDSIYLNFILNDKRHVLPAAHPVEFELRDPQGKSVVKIVKTSGVNNIYAFHTATSPEAKTGTYRAMVKVGNETFYHAVKVESIKPNRLKMDLQFDNEILRSYEPNNAVLSSEWLHGAKASGLNASVNVSLFNAHYDFNGYEDYYFSDPTRSFSSEEILLVEQKLDDNGKTKFEATFPTVSSAPGMLKANFVTRVYEKSGNFSIDQVSKYLSPYKQYVGVKIPKGSLEYGTLVTDQVHKLEFASVDESGIPTDKQKLQVKIYKLSWRWWWSRSEDLSSFIGSNSIIPAIDTVLTTSKGLASFNYQVNRPEWGRYFVQVTNVESGHTAGKIFYVDWPYWARKNRKNNENATMLTFSTDKTKYNKDEDVKVTIPAATKGKALICVENGYEILDKYWIDIQKGDNQTSFKAKPGMAPNVYVHVTSILEHSETSEDQPSRLYGIVPIYVEDPMTRLHPQIAIADSIRPDEINKVKVAEKDGKAMTYTLAIVDEGLLQLTGYHAPNPWDHFFKKQALGVRTWDMYDDVLGSFAGKWGNKLSLGGDGSAGNASKPVRANRFKPVVRFFGPFHLEAGKTASHSFNITNYVGAVRVMVIASDVSKNAYGKDEKHVKVKKPLMVLATMPRVVSPGEELSFPVNVFAMNNQVKDVNIKVTANDMLTLPEGNTKTIHFTKSGDQIVKFPVKVKSKVGLAKIAVEVSGHGEKATHEIELDVRPPNPRITKAREWVLKGNESAKDVIDLFGMEGTNDVTLEVSTLPSINLKKRLEYLIHYPHGCIEQTTSTVFPQLALDELVDLSPAQRKSISYNVQAGITRLYGFITTSGGLAYWPGSNHPSPWGSNYAGHFWLEAQKRGYKVSKSAISDWVSYQSREARNWSSNTYENDDHTQAYRLYTLALAGSPDVSAMNRLREYPELSNMARWRLAAAYGLIGKPEAAKALIDKATTTVQDYRELGNTFGSRFRDMAMILDAMVQMGDVNNAANMVVKVASEMSKDRWMSTQETAYGLLAVSAFAGSANVKDDATITYKTGGGATKQLELKKHMHTIELGKDDMKGKEIQIANTSNGIVYVKLVRGGVPEIGDTSKASEGVWMSIRYTGLDGNEIDVTSLAQGTQFIAEVQVGNNGSRGYVEQLALMQMMPSGWEIQNTRMHGSAISEDGYTYRDQRDDRVMTYFNLPVRQSITYRILLTATYQGNFYLPAQSVEAMYDHAIRANIPGQWVKVTEPPLEASK